MTTTPPTEDDRRHQPDRGSAARRGDRRAAALEAGQPRLGVGVCATLVVLAAALGTGGYFALRSQDQSAVAARAEAAAMQAAKDCVTATQAPDTSAMEASQRKIIDCATGDFSVQANLYSGVLVDAYQAANAQVQVSDMRAAVERHNDDGSMDVLVALRVAVSNSAAPEPGDRIPAAGDDGAGQRHVQDRQARPGDEVTAVLTDIGRSGRGSRRTTPAGPAGVLGCPGGSIRRRRADRLGVVAAFVLSPGRRRSGAGCGGCA